MNTTFSALFKKYRLRSEIATLSELADVLAKKGFIYEYSLLSHWQKGDRIPNRKTLLVLINIFLLRKGITDLDEANELLASAQEGYITHLEAVSFSESDHYVVELPDITKYSALDVIDYISLIYQTIRSAREKGHLQYVMDTIEPIIRKTYGFALNERQKKYKDQYLSLIIRLLFEKAYAIGRTKLPTITLPLVQQITNEQISLASMIDSPFLLMFARNPLAFNYYSLGEYSQNKSYHETSLKIIQQDLEQPAYSDELYVYNLRLVALNAMYLNSEELFDKTKQRIYQYIQENEHDDHTPYIVQGLGAVVRGEAYFGRTEATDTLERCKSLNLTISWTDPFREAMIVREELEVCTRLNIMSEQNYIKAKAKDGMRIADQYQIARYQKIFSGYL